MQSDQQRQCIRNHGNGNRCSDIALPASPYCHKHRIQREAYDEKRRKGPKREFSHITHLPSGELRCRKVGKRWQCHEKAATSGLYCDKHKLSEDTRNKNRRKGPPKPNRTLMILQSLDHSGNQASTSMTPQLTDLNLTREASNIEDVITNPDTNDGVEQASSGEPTMQQQLERDASKKMTRKGQCRRAGKGWRCQEIAASGIYCEKHQLKRKRPTKSNNIEDINCGKETSSGATKSGREVTKRQSARKRLRDKETISADLVPGLCEMELKKCGGVSIMDEHEESGWVGTQKTASPDNQPSSDSNMEITSREATMNFQEAQGLVSVTNCYITSDDHTSTCEQVHIEKTSEVIDEDIEKTHDHIDIGKYNQIKGIGLDNITITCAKSPMKCQKSQNLNHDDRLPNAIDDEQNDAVMLPFRSDYYSREELQENEGLSFVTDGAMNAVDFSFAQMEAEKDSMEVLAGVHSTAYVGDSYPRKIRTDF